MFSPHESMESSQNSQKPIFWWFLQHVRCSYRHSHKCVQPFITSWHTHAHSQSNNPSVHSHTERWMVSPSITSFMVRTALQYPVVVLYHRIESAMQRKWMKEGDWEKSVFASETLKWKRKYWKGGNEISILMNNRKQQQQKKVKTVLTSSISENHHGLFATFGDVKLSLNILNIDYGKSWNPHIIARNIWNI